MKHHIPHTTTFEPLISLQIENGDTRLQVHRDTCTRNATYESYTTVVELLASISEVLKKNILSCLHTSEYYSLIADESTDSASKEELSVCARWLHDGKVVEHFLGIIHVRETTAKSISDHLIVFLKSLNISLTKLWGLGFDGASNMLGHRSGVQRRLKYIHP